MRFMRKSKFLAEERSAGDPMEAVANLFDTAVVFIAALLLALLTFYDAKEIFSKDASFTMVRRNAKGEMTLISKKGRKIKAVKVTPEEAAGRGTKLGTAYKLEDGSVVYVSRSMRKEALNAIANYYGGNS